MQADNDSFVGAPDEAASEGAAESPAEFDGLDEGLVEDSDAVGDDADVLEDIEHEGKTYQVPKGLKGAFLRQADYTRKTQELAAERRAVEADKSTSAEALQMRAGIVALEQKIAACESLDWERLRQEEPNEAARLQDHLHELVAAHGELSQGLNQWNEHRTQAEEQEQLARLHQGHLELARDIPGWSPEHARRLADFAVSEFGASQEELSEIQDPRIVKLLHVAYLAANGQVLSRGAIRHLEAQSARPAATVGGRASAGKNPNRMSTDEWMRHRNKQLRASAQ